MNKESDKKFCVLVLSEDARYQKAVRVVFSRREDWDRFWTLLTATPSLEVKSGRKYNDA